MPTTRSSRTRAGRTPASTSSRTTLVVRERPGHLHGIGAGGPSDNLIFRNNVLVENTVGDMMASYGIVDQSVFVANSGENLVGGIRYAYRVYDGAGQVRDSHFIGWDATNANFLINTGAAIKHPNHTFTGNTMSPAGPPRTSLEDFDIRPVPGTHATTPGTRGTRPSCSVTSRAASAGRPTRPSCPIPVLAGRRRVPPVELRVARTGATTGSPCRGSPTACRSSRRPTSPARARRRGRPPPPSSTSTSTVDHEWHSSRSSSAKALNTPMPRVPSPP